MSNPSPPLDPTPDWLRLLLEKAMVSVIDGDGTILFESPSIQESLGYRYGELLGKSGWVLIHPDEHAMMRVFMDEALAGRGGRREVRYLHKEGHVHWMEVQTIPIEGKRILVYRRDITARREAEIALDRTNRLLAAIAEVQALFIDRSEGAAFDRLLHHFVDFAEAHAGVLVRNAPDRSLLAHGEPRVAEVLARACDEAIASGAAKIDGDVVAAPLRESAGEIVGAFALHRARAIRALGDLDRLQSLVLTASRIVASSRDRVLRERAEHEAALLKRLVFAIEGASGLDAAIEVVLREIVEQTGWDLGQAWMRRKGTDRLECSPQWFSADPERFGAFHARSLETTHTMADGMVGRVWTSKTRAWVDDAEARSRGYPRVAAAAESGLVESFAIPVLADGEVTAVLEFFSSERRADDAWLLEIVCAAAAQIGASLERKRVERELRMLDFAVRSMSDPVVIVTATPGSRQILYANDAFTSLMGFTNPVGQSASIVMGPATDQEAIERARDLIIAERRSVRHETTFYRADGSRIEIELTVTPIFDGPGAHRHSVVILRDLAAIRRDEAERAALRNAVEEAEVTWRQTFDALALPLVLVAPSGKIERMNSAAEKLADARWVGRELPNVADREPWTSASRLIADVLRTERSAVVQVPVVDDGRTWEVTLELLGPMLGVLLIARDVTAVVALHESLRRSETTAALGRLIAGVAHEVRNPLFGIGATLDAFETRFGPSDGTRYFRVLRGELTRLSDLMRDLLEYGKPPQLAPAPHGVAEIVDEAIARCAAVADRAGVSLRRPSDLRADDVLFADRTRMVQVFINLLENAIQHSPRGGTVSVSIAGRGARSLSLSIEDDGPGFPITDLARLFEPFYSRRAGGTGLGLSIVQRIVEQHGGKIVAANRATGGASMTLSLPSVSAFEEERAHA